VLLLTSTSDKLQVVTGTAVTVDVHASWIDLASGTVTAGRTNSKITTATTTDVVAAPAASTTRNVKTLHVCNIHASSSVAVTVQHTDGTNTYVEGLGMRIFDASGMEKVPVTTIAGQLLVARLAADVSNSTTTAAKITGLDASVGVGTWIFEYYVLYQAAATTTGIKLSVNHTGTVTSFVDWWFGTDATATAATAALSQAANAATGQVFSVWSARAKSTAAGMGPSISVDSANADMLAVIEGIMVVTVAGNIELYHASEVAAASTVKAGSAVRLTRVG
jgi:hypothetical protein